MTLRWRSDLTGSEVHEADARVVAQTLTEGSVTLSILDGPYNLGKAEWDRVPKGGSLGDLYTGHLDDVNRLSAQSASLYVWNTSQGWAELHPLILARGWTFRSLIVWDKQIMPSMLGWETAKAWLDVTEVCGFYTRGTPVFTYPSGNPRNKPGEHIRIVSNVWPFSSGAYHHERIKGDAVIHRDGTPGFGQLHPCQKPLLFAERMIKASSRPGDTVWVPFGGTLREMVANERLSRSKQSDVRKVISCELNLDGKDYIGPAIAQAQGLPTQTTNQTGLFG